MSWKRVPWGSPARFTVVRQRSPKRLRPMGFPLTWKTSPAAGFPVASSTVAVPNAWRCADRASSTTAGAGTLRNDARVFGGPSFGVPVFGVTSWRSTRTCRPASQSTGSDRQPHRFALPEAEPRADHHGRPEERGSGLGQRPHLLGRQGHDVGPDDLG